MTWNSKKGWEFPDYYIDVVWKVTENGSGDVKLLDLYRSPSIMHISKVYYFLKIVCLSPWPVIADHKITLLWNFTISTDTYGKMWNTD